MDLLKLAHRVENEGISKVEMSIATDAMKALGRKMGEDMWRDIGTEMGFKAGPTGQTIPVAGAEYFGGGIMIPVELSGSSRKTVKMLIDTGEDAADMIIPETLAKELGITPDGSETITGVTGSARAYFAAVDVSIDIIHVGKAKILVDPTLGQTPPLIGYPFFHSNRLSLTLIPAEAGPVVVIDKIA